MTSELNAQIQPLVTPAEAGVQGFCRAAKHDWIPVFAGMTEACYFAIIYVAAYKSTRPAFCGPVIIPARQVRALGITSRFSMDMH